MLDLFMRWCLAIILAGVAGMIVVGFVYVVVTVIDLLAKPNR